MNGFSRMPPFRKRTYVCAAAAALLWPLSATAQTQDNAGNGDLAKAWIDYLFFGDSMPDALASYAAPLSFAADGLRQALGVYSIGMLVVAAMLVFYHIAAMVAETAHSGVPFGRRASQIWTPIRFVVALSLLIPVNSSLSAGQYLVLKIAGEGSAMASRAWRTVLESTSGHLSGLAAPHGPEVSRLVAAAVEMEICRAVYQQIYVPLDKDTVIHIAGNIGDIAKLPADRFAPETWRYTNALNADVPLCGEYRFPGYRRPVSSPRIPDGAVSRMADSLSSFAHAQADDLQNQARNLGEQTGAAFVSAAAPIGADIHNDLASLEASVATRLGTEQRDISAAAASGADQILAESADAGWFTAASFIPEFVRLQDSYSELMENALPVAQGPVFAHQKMMQKILNDAVAASPYFAPLKGEVPDSLDSFYNKVSHATVQVHSWLYGSQLPDADSAAPSAADLSDRLNAATDPGAISSFFAQALDASAFAAGVWGEDQGSTDTGYPFAAIPATASYNPFAALVEFGRRQTELASRLTSLAGAGLANPGAAGPSILLGATGLLFFLGGIVLVFIAPLLPFLRFLLAAVGWIINVFEAVAAMPLVALAHLTPEGEGISGSIARQAYLLWLVLLIRPILTLFGFVFGLLVFALSLAFLDAVLTPFARLAMPSNGGMVAGANIGLVLLYDVLAYAAANASFKGIHWLPDQALRWTSRFVAVTNAEEAPAQTFANSPARASTTTIVAPSGTQAIASGANVQVSVTGGPSGSGSSGSFSSNTMKSALFPSYAEKSPPGSASSATSILSPTASHISERSIPGSGLGPGSAQVSVNASATANITGKIPRADRARGDKSDKHRFSGGENEATVGGGERPAKNAPKETPKDDPSGS